MSTEMPCAYLIVGGWGIITYSLEEEGIQRESVQETGIVHRMTAGLAHE